VGIAAIVVNVPGQQQDGGRHQCLVLRWWWPSLSLSDAGAKEPSSSLTLGVVVGIVNVGLWTM